MRRILMVATFVAVAQTITAFSDPALQTPTTTTTLRRITVNAQTIAALAPGRTYVVDLTQRGVKYEFSPQAGQIDFGRVRVRIARGEVTIGSFLETLIPKDKLAALRYTSRPFSLGTRPTGTLQQIDGTSDLECTPQRCICTGERNCEDMLNGTLCDHWFCTAGSPGPVICLCARCPTC